MTNATITASFSIDTTAKRDVIKANIAEFYFDGDTDKAWELAKPYGNRSYRATWIKFSDDLKTTSEIIVKEDTDTVQTLELDQIEVEKTENVELPINAQDNRSVIEIFFERIFSVVPTLADCDGWIDRVFYKVGNLMHRGVLTTLVSNTSHCRPTRKRSRFIFDVQALDIRYNANAIGSMTMV